MVTLDEIPADATLCFAAGLYVESAWLRTDASWRWLTAPEFTLHDKHIVGVGGYFRIRYPQIADGRKVLAGDIHDASFDDSGWQSAFEVTDGPWLATPGKTEIPGHRETPIVPRRVLAVGRLVPAQPVSDDPMSISAGIRTSRCEPVVGSPVDSIEGHAGESRYITFDFERPVHGYPFIELADATAGTVVDFGYGEVSYSQYSGHGQVESTGCLNTEAIVG